MFKKVMVFSGLKIAEIGGLVFAWWALCHLGTWLENIVGLHGLFWLSGLFPVIILVLLSIGVVVLVEIIKLNIEWTKRLTGGK